MDKLLEKLNRLAFEAGWEAAIENHMYVYIGMAEDETEAFKKWNDAVSDQSEQNAVCQGHEHE